MTNAAPQHNTDALTINQALKQAIAHHKDGRVQIAEQIYRAIIEAQPDANHNLGVLSVQAGQPLAGLPFLKTALEANPSQDQFWISYVVALVQTNQIDTARQVLEQGRQHGLQGKTIDVLAEILKYPAATTVLQPYVFIIGFNKTATTSLHRLFEDSRFPSLHWDEGNLALRMLSNCLHDKPVLEGYDHKFKVYSDMMYRSNKIMFEGNSLFRVLDTDYPNSFFIYNYRNMEDWLQSRLNHRGAIDGMKLIDFAMKSLKTDQVQKVFDHWAKQRVDFESAIREYFSGNPRFLEVDIDDPEVPQKISRLIGVELDKDLWGIHNKT
jgi:hypothetical protein